MKRKTVTTGAIADKISHQYGISLNDARILVNDVFESIIEHIILGNNVNIVNYFTFKPVTRSWNGQSLKTVKTRVSKAVKNRLMEDEPAN